MADNPDKLLDSALDEFEEPVEENKEENIEQTIKETIENLGDLGIGEGEMPELPGDMESIFNKLTEELEGNPELKEEFDKIGDDLFGGNILSDSMTELKDKLNEYIQKKRDELSSEELARYSAQLDLYKKICDNLAQDRQTEAMELVAKLSEFGELPSELLPPMPEECRII